jgi:four helix bundle suffix protein
LEELRLDYEDFLRQRGMPILEPDDPVLKRFKARRCSTLEEVRVWVEEERRRAQTDTDEHGHVSGVETSVAVRASPKGALPSSALVANAALSLLNVCCYLLDRQLEAQANAFEREGGFTERLYRRRQSRKRGA